MAIPFLQTLMVGSYVVRQRLSGRKRYPLVLMLGEPLFRCNLACAGCGKIDYPDEILNKRIPVADALEAVDECGAPVVSIAGGEPLLHKELPQIVEGIIARRKFVYLCTNALLMMKNLKKYKPSPFFVWSVHLDGDQEMHDKSVCQDGVYERAVEAIKAAKAMGFRVNINCTLFNNSVPEQVAAFFDTLKPMGVDGITVSPGYRLSARRTSNTSSTVPKRRSCSARSSVAVITAATGRSASRACSSIFLPATSPMNARRGARRPVPCSAGSVPATSSARAMRRPSASSWRRPIGTPTAPATMRSAPTAWCIAASRRPPSTTPSRTRSKRRSPRSAACGRKAPWSRRFRCTRSGRAQYMFERQVKEQMVRMHTAEPKKQAAGR